MVAKEKEKVASREEVKKAKKAQQAKKVKDTSEQNNKIRIRIRLIPIWVRVLLLIIFMMVSTLVGLVVGYGVIGNGNPEDALNKSTWQHIIDLVEKQ